MQTIPLLISRDDLKTYRKISNNLTKEQVEPFIYDSQEFDLSEFLGDELYIDLLDNYTSEDKYTKLLDGESFIYPVDSGRKKKFRGLKAALCYFTLARLASEGHIHITATGSYEKNNEFSTSISSAERQRVSNNFRDLALRVLADAKLYLDAGKIAGDFDLWKNSCSSGETPGREPGIGMASRLKNRRSRPRFINGDWCDC